MKISKNKFFRLSSEEITFMFCMMRKYGGLEKLTSTDENSKSYYDRKKKRIKSKKDRIDIQKPIESGIPKLYDPYDASWDQCTDEKFLIFQQIMKKIECDE